MIKKNDAELAQLFNVDRVTVTRWRNKKRYPKFDQVLQYEDKTKLPFECFLSRNPDLDAIEKKLFEQIINLQKIKSMKGKLL